MDNQLRNYILLAIGILSIVILIYIINFSSYDISNSSADWGQFGAYVGGVAGAFLTLFTVILLIKTLDSQNKNASINQFETSFFELFRLHKEITNRIVGEVNIVDENAGIDETGIYSGLKFFEKLSEIIDRHYDGNYRNIIRTSLVEARGVNTEVNEEMMQAEIDNFYNSLYRGRESELGHYFRSLYHLVKFVDDSKVNNKQKYVDLIQAYLTDAELHCTFYNGIAIYGRDKFKPLLDKYSFLENIKSRGNIFDRQLEVFYPNTYSNYSQKPRPN